MKFLKIFHILNFVLEDFYIFLTFAKNVKKTEIADHEISGTCKFLPMSNLEHTVKKRTPLGVKQVCQIIWRRSLFMGHAL